MSFREFFEGILPFKLVRNLLIILLVVILLAAAFAFCTYTVQENEVAVVKRMGEIVDVKDTAGLKFKIPFLFHIEKFPTSYQYLDVSKSEVLTKDKKNYVIDTFSIWRISDVETFVRTARTMSSAEEQQNAVIYSSTKTILGQQKQDALIGVGYESGRDFVNEEITRVSNNTVKNLGVEICGVEIKALDVPEENESAIYERMISERKQLSASYRASGEMSKNKLINAADREITILLAQANETAERLRGEAEAEYMRIWAEAYNTPEKLEFYRFVRSLEAIEKSLSNGEGNTLILSGDSKLAKIIAGE